MAAVLLNLGPGRGHAMPVLLSFDLDGQRLRGHLVQWSDAERVVELGGSELTVTLTAMDRDGCARITIDGLTDTVAWHADGPRLLMHWRARNWTVDDQGRAAAASQASGSSDGSLRATMNGRVVAVQVAVGDSVQAGQALVTLEAMKMEHVHAAPRAGVVTALHVAVGEQVAARRVLVQVGDAV